jgi:hypothetical protein
MEALKLLFGSWTGILTIFTLVFATGFLIFIFAWVMRKSKSGG